MYDNIKKKAVTKEITEDHFRFLFDGHEFGEIRREQIEPYEDMWSYKFPDGEKKLLASFTEAVDFATLFSAIHFEAGWQYIGRQQA